ncbi:YidC/Oxa1 family membrane protein insertase [Acetitomaculum ruminis DSM 5522]|uniref:YidC/Oxa1 family membrane protein insertase n=1 Tax=Acetitomaculum ruminis DSM 5522 TaxID=1120918 RepID=A0A1I0ZH02_9FIRM|nr:YidC/Oxa1 family membrane protein insertase [Acetitomaculum ruminis]SFB23678.1 YidC/Oxa1 family membrane protein insertase [Acetitomaculum ruminis DSM 5522]
MGILLTQSTTFIIGPIAQLLGWIMNGIFSVLSNLGIENIGLCIIIFTVIMYLLMLPLTIRQQKFSKLTAVMSPEIQAVQKKYAGKRDQESMMKMNEETKEIYEKYGTSPSGSCVQMAIQFPVMFALYQVIYNVPAYVSSVKAVFTPVIDKIIGISGYQDLLQKFVKSEKIGRVALDFTSDTTTTNTIVDLLYRLSTGNWNKLAKTFPDIASSISSVQDSIKHFNSFLGLNIGDSPADIIRTSFGNGSFGILIMAVLIPVLAGATQFINFKLMPQAKTNNDNSSMASSMKMMNYSMPLMSAFFCLTFPAGIGLYWITSALVRSVQQICINKYLDSIDMEAEIAKNQEKAKAKRKKKEGLEERQIVNNATIKTKNIKDLKSIDYTAKDLENIKPGSMTDKANMVRKFNEKNNK